MAHWIRGKITDFGATGQDWITKIAYRTIKKLANISEFYELEPAEVVKVALLEDDIPDIGGGKNYNFLGAVKARKLNSDAEKGPEELKWMLPLNSTINNYPVIGECVLTVKIPSLGRDFYIQTMGLGGKINENSVGGISWIGSRGALSFLEESDVSDVSSTGTPSYSEGDTADDKQILGKIFETSEKPILKLQPLEGDIIFQGRFGQSIRFGSNQTEEGDGQKESPNILIRAGQLMDGESPDVGLVNEDINADGSSIWMTTDQKVDLQWAHEDGVGPPPLEGKNIVLNSDRIIFNAKVDEIYGSAKTRITFEAPEILLGADGSQGNIPNGELLVAALSSLVDLVKKMTTKPPQSPFPPDIGLALPQVKKDLEESINTIAFVQMKE